MWASFRKRLTAPVTGQLALIDHGVLDEKTIPTRPATELAANLPTHLSEKQRQAGGGRPRARKKDPALEATLPGVGPSRIQLADPMTGWQMAELPFGRSSGHWLGKGMASAGPVMAACCMLTTIICMPTPELSGPAQPERNAQFEHIIEQARRAFSGGAAR